MTETLLQSLTASGASIVALAGGIDIEEWTWRPDEHRWSCLEILCHLVDEERDDFRTRIMQCLRDPDEAWPPIDPGEWARSRDYLARDPARVVREFETERATSLQWLRQLVDPGWDNTYRHPRMTLRAGDLLASWAAHDAMHLRQMTNNHLRYLGRADAAYSTRYADA